VIPYGTVSTEHDARRRGNIARLDAHATTCPRNIISKDLSRRAAHVNSHRRIRLSPRHIIILHGEIVHFIDAEDPATITAAGVQAEVRNSYAVDDNFIARGPGDEKRLAVFERRVGNKQCVGSGRDDSRSTSRPATQSSKILITFSSGRNRDDSRDWDENAGMIRFT
jgi:hypothetical protein